MISIKIVGNKNSQVLHFYEIRYFNILDSRFLIILEADLIREKKINYNRLNNKDLKVYNKL